MDNYGRSFNVADSGGQRITCRNEKLIRWHLKNWNDSEKFREIMQKKFSKYIEGRLKDVYINPKVQWEKASFLDNYK